MLNIKRLFAVTGLFVGLSAGAAMANPHVSINVGLGIPVAPVVVGYQPAPVYVAPRPVYVQPRPVYYAPRPVYVVPRPVAYYPGRDRGHWDDRRGWDNDRGHDGWNHDRR